MVWSLAFLFAVAMTIEQTVELVLDYLEYEVAVAMGVGFHARPFPAVTLCSLSPFPASQLARIPPARRIVPSPAALHTSSPLNDTPRCGRWPTASPHSAIRWA